MSSQSISWYIASGAALPSSSAVSSSAVSSAVRTASSTVSRKQKLPMIPGLPLIVLSSQVPERSSVNSKTVGEQLQRSCADAVAARAADRSAVLLAMVLLERCRGRADLNG